MNIEEKLKTSALKQIQQMKEQKEYKIQELRKQLSDDKSPIGDWKISKIIEYEKLGLPIPYNIEELHAQRQEIRDQINTLEEGE